MNPWLWLTILAILLFLAFLIAYRFAPEGTRTKLTQLLTLVAGLLAAGLGQLTDVDWSQFEQLGPLTAIVIPGVLAWINNKLRDVTTTPPKNLIFKKDK